MPNLEGITATIAQEELASLGFEVIVVEEEFSNDMLEGFVTRTDPPAGASVSSEQTITIFVSKGTEPFLLSDFTGLTLPDAQALAAERGLVIVVDPETVDVTPASGLAGKIASQTPSAGTEVVSGQEIHVRLGVSP